MTKTNIKTKTFIGGLDLKFLPDAEFESLSNIAVEEHPPIIARNALRLLMMGWPADAWTSFLSWPVIKAVFIYRDPALLKELRYAFQQGFEFLFTQLKGQKFTADQSEQVQLYLSNCLSLLPYSDLTPYESIKIPQNINGEWVLVDYHVTPIELTPTTGFHSWFIHDHDRVFAYGLEPINNPEAQSHLIFMGTTYPAGQGFVPQVKTDLKGFETVGESLYASGREKIKEWLLEQKKKIHVCGVSLGGSLSLLLAIDLGDHIQRVDPLNPAGLHDSENDSQYDNWDGFTNKPQVVVQCQGDDPVSLFGIWKKEWDILQVKAPVDKKGPNALCDHFMNYAGHPETEFTHIDPEQENTQRKSRNFWIYSVARGFVYYTAIIPYNYVLRPVSYFVINHWLSITAGLLSLATLGAAITMTLTGTLPLFGLACALAVTSLAAGFIIYNKFFQDSALTESKNNNLANLHDPLLPRNPSMDIYNKDNKIEIKLSPQALHTYYKVMHGLVKEKQYVPDEEQPSIDNKFARKELAGADIHSEAGHELIPVLKTKAKAVHIRNVLTLVDKLGLENVALKEALKDTYQQYRVGKHS